MSFMNWIIEELNDASDFFYSIYREVNDWVWPFWLAAEFFYDLCRVFNWLAWDFLDFADWVNDVAYKITSFFTELDLDAWFQQWKTRILDSWDWVRYAWSNVTSIVGEWWSTTWTDVKGYIDIATQGLDTLKAAWDSFWRVTFPEWTGKLDSLRAAWDNFWTTTFPNLVSFQWLTEWWNTRLMEIDQLINDTVRTWFPFYDDLVELWNGIVEFFVDPLEWLLDRFTDWFLGPEV